MGHDQNESEIRQLVEGIAAGIRSKDLPKVMAVYAEDVVVYDVPPPLAHHGSAAVHRNMERWFGGFEGPIGFEMRDVRIAAGPELALAHATHRVTGRTKAGVAIDMWVRWTAGLRRIDGTWKIIHEHVSVPLQM